MQSSSFVHLPPPPFGVFRHLSSSFAVFWVIERTLFIVHTRQITVISNWDWWLVVRSRYRSSAIVVCRMLQVTSKHGYKMLRSPHSTLLVRTGARDFGHFGTTQFLVYEAFKHNQEYLYKSLASMWREIDKNNAHFLRFLWLTLNALLGLHWLITNNVCKMCEVCGDLLLLLESRKCLL